MEHPQTPAVEQPLPSSDPDRNRLEINAVDGSRPPVTTRFGGFSGGFTLTLGRRFLLLCTGKGHAHMLRWGTGRLTTVATIVSAKSNSVTWHFSR